MGNRNEQFLNLYQTHRHEEQADWYQGRSLEFKSARRQAVITAGVLMLLTTIISVMTAANLFALKWVWATLSILFPALSTALTAYNSLFAFEQQLKLYNDASRGLVKARDDAKKLRKSTDDADYQKKVEDYVGKIEGIFSKEQGQWGQLINEIKPVEPPTTAEEDE
jgi:SMODS and SLOG-associating 2TM effector domain 1